MEFGSSENGTFTTTSAATSIAPVAVVEVRRHIGLGDGGREAVYPVGDLAGDLVEVQSVDEFCGIGERGFDRRR